MVFIKINIFKLPTAGNNDFSKKMIQRAELTNRKLNLENSLNKFVAHIQVFTFRILNKVFLFNNYNLVFN